MTAIVASAPGRVNLIGEHTDYNGGLVLPAAIPQGTTVELTRRPDRRVVVDSATVGERGEYELGHEARRGGWLDYVMGCTHALAATGARLGGCHLAIRSDVPLGSGLSSSAALEVAVLRALRSAFGLDLDDVNLALVAQRAENEIVGAPVGAMDQMSASLGELGFALFIDMRTLASRRIAMPAAIDLVVIASGVRHDLAAGDYRVRRAECEEAARTLGVTSLRELGVDDLPRLTALGPKLARRVRHVVTENARVLAAVEALERADLEALGQLFAESHASMRLDYEVSVPAIDTLVTIAAADPDVAGARLTGGGFGGSIVALATRGSGARAARRIAARYALETGLVPHVLVAGPLAAAPAAVAR